MAGSPSPLKRGDPGGYLQLNSVALQKQVTDFAGLAVKRCVDGAPRRVLGFERVNAEQFVTRLNVEACVATRQAGPSLRSG